MTLLVALVAGLLIGLTLGALGGGGSVLAVPVLVYVLGQTAAQATTGSLVVVGADLPGRRSHRPPGRQRAARPRRRVRGRRHRRRRRRARGSPACVPEPVLLAAFAALMLIVGAVMAVPPAPAPAAGDPAHAAPGRRLDDPIISFSPTFACQCPRALKVLVTATVVGLLTGFLGVGGGFLVVPVLVLALGLPDGRRRRHLPGRHHHHLGGRARRRAGTGVTPTGVSSPC